MSHESIRSLIALLVTGRTLQGLIDGRSLDRIGELLQRFKELKDRFDRGVGVQVLNQVLSSGKNRRWLRFTYGFEHCLPTAQQALLD